jgi:hypothetical protein
MTTTLVLLPSPLLGPAVWAAVGSVLAEDGWTVAIPPAFGRIQQPADVLDHWERALAHNGDYVLVPHSNAGHYVPALGERRNVLGTVFADAALPPASGSTGMAPPALYRMLTGLADPDGVLPPWTEWWEHSELAGLFPDAATQAAVTAEQVRLPLSYFDERTPAAAGWALGRNAYLAFGDTYRHECEVAANYGWPVRTLPGGHLLMLTKPARVASVLEGLLGVLKIDR